MSFIKPFSELGKGDAAIAGGKGASLGEMTQAGISVPPGFALLSEAFEQFLKETDLNVEIDATIHSVNPKEMHTIEHASEKIQALILNAQMPSDIAQEVQKFFTQLDTKYVAVRSSATAEDSASAAWAGQLDSYLNTTEETLLKNVQRCWASLFTPRAIFYRFEKKLHTQKISVAVVVQKMVESECSGIAFSVHPVTEDYNQLIIEAGFGLGEAIVSGSVTPDSYVVEKEPRRIIDINVSTQSRALYRVDGGGNEWRDIAEPQASSQVLTEAQVLELSETIVGIERHYGFPCDIEWAYEQGKFYIVQSRPITTLSHNRNPQATQSIVETIKNTEWHVDWGGPFPLLDVSTAAEVYFDTFNELFNISFSNFFIIYKNGIASARLPLAEYETIGNTLADKAVDVLYVEKWMSEFRRISDQIMAAIKITPQEFLRNLESLRRLYQLYGTYQVATKIGFNFLSSDTPETITKLFEDTRKYSELFYRDNGVLLAGVAELIASQNIPYKKEHISMMTIDELRVYLKDQSLPDIQALRQRADCVGVYWDQTGTHLLPPSEVHEVEAYWLNTNHDTTTLKGVTAYAGVVRGKCRVVLNYEEANLEEGEVLVTGMTDPHFVPLMKKAASRELKIPCVIGTKFATQLLKDGDFVEVDADKGVVRILSIKEELEPEQYLRMFAGKSFPFLFSDLFLRYYKALGVLSLQSEDSWMSLFPKAREVETLTEGARLYTSEREYKDYKSQFDEYITSSAQTFDQILGKDSITGGDVEEFLTLVSKLFSYYSKTEFFYTDKIDQSKMVITIKEFDELKLEGRTYLNKIFFEGNGYIKSLIAKIAKTKNIPESALLNYGANELVQLVDTDARIEPAEVKNRDTFFQSSGRALFGRDAHDTLDEFFSAYRERADVIHGTVANKGRVRGKARVLVPDAKDFDKIAHAVAEMKEGEILIAETTSPDIIAACNKAAAIVTNQGGMLSHAAIVSRELGIPCVIGTDKDVILNINTGDEIEVDADRGVVTILVRK